MGGGGGWEAAEDKRDAKAGNMWTNWVWKEQLCLADFTSRFQVGFGDTDSWGWARGTTVPHPPSVYSRFYLGLRRANSEHCLEVIVRVFRGRLWLPGIHSHTPRWVSLQSRYPRVIRKGPLVFLNRNPHRLPETSPEWNARPRGVWIRVILPLRKSDLQTSVPLIGYSLNQRDFNCQH